MKIEKTILLIEDEPPLMKVIQARLEKNDIKVTTARTVKEALLCLGSKNQVDAIWLDHYLLGEESGIDFVKKLKQSKNSWENIPIFVVSNTASSSNIKTYRELGIDKYYVKAIHKLDEIINEIKPLMMKLGR